MSDEYLVKFEIDVDADNLVAAAVTAWDLLTHPRAQLPVAMVRKLNRGPNGARYSPQGHSVDLDELPQDHALRTRRGQVADRGLYLLLGNNEGAPILGPFRAIDFNPSVIYVDLLIGRDTEETDHDVEWEEIPLRAGHILYNHVVYFGFSALCAPLHVEDRKRVQALDMALVGDVCAQDILESAALPWNTRRSRRTSESREAHTRGFDLS